ncbi:unnamed protein product [Paramecium sonneborni]|uniref:Uncharacterized protein n=1 Tax=Paramecium sonneborni TaxID=65129 RepID=A0A8S1KE14_9CILI|nr:unnamed protein product [Paramecium sonneborni]
MMYYIVFSNEDLYFNCSLINNITQCLKASNFCYVVEANVTYLSVENKIEGVILDEVNDVCMNLNFFTVCDQLYTEKSCKLGNCVWDPIYEQCFKWDSAPCSSYPKSICQWNHGCEIINQTKFLYLNQNYTLMNDVDTIQNDGRRIGTWLYEFGLIIDVLQIETDKEEYKFTKCTLKNRCEQIQIIDYNQADYECYISDLNCYFDIQEGKCKKLSAQTQCELIKWDSQCNSGTVSCIWINKQCQMYNKAAISCAQLDQSRCLNNENCYLQNFKCIPYLSCFDFSTKIGCDESSFFCYFDEFEKSCKQLTRNIQCKMIGAKNCKEFKYCNYNQNNNNCEEIHQDFYCQKFVKDDCPNKNNVQTIECLWNDNLQICNWNYQSQNCNTKTNINCDSLTCYYDDVLDKCSTINLNTPCEFLGQISCKQQNLCQWSKSRNQCLSIFDFNCEDLLTKFCLYSEKCFLEDQICKTRKQCKDNESIIDCQDDSNLNCYFDYNLKKCRRVTIYTACNLIFNKFQCNQAICSWVNNKCESIEKVSCKQIGIHNCIYSSKCLLQNNQCISLDICEENNGNSDGCEKDKNHCFYNTNTQICKHIDGTTDCNSLNGADNCNYAHCTLIHLENYKLQCIQYEYAECAWLSQEYCNFGQCTWDQNRCISYPINKFIENPEQDNQEQNQLIPDNIDSHNLLIFINLLIIILE